MTDENEEMMQSTSSFSHENVVCRIGAGSLFWCVFLLCFSLNVEWCVKKSAERYNLNDIYSTLKENGLVRRRKIYTVNLNLVG